MEKASSVVLVLLLFGGLEKEVNGRNQVKITRYQTCTEEQGVIKLHGHVTTENDDQFLYVNATLPFALDEKVGVNLSIQTPLNDKFRTIHTIHEKNLCRAANLYLGEYWYNTTRALKMPVKSCPIKAGFYQADRVPMNLNQLPLQGFPLGKLRFIVNAVNNSNPAMSFICILEEVQYVHD